MDGVLGASLQKERICMYMWYEDVMYVYSVYVCIYVLVEKRTSSVLVVSVVIEV